MPDDIHLTPDELVTRWKGAVKKETLATWRFRKEGPPFTKVGSRVLYPLQGVQQYEKERMKLCANT